MAQLPSFNIEETFATSPETMYNLWTSPAHLQQWFGPLGSKVSYNRLELKNGGDYLYCLTNPDGSEHWGKWHFLDIIPNKKLILLNSFSDKNGGLTRHPFHAEWPLQLTTEVDFEASGNATKVRVSWTPFEAPENEVNAFAAAIPSMNQGWGGTFHQLGEYISTL